jgi:hypothetical protein
MTPNPEQTLGHSPSGRAQCVNKGTMTDDEIVALGSFCETLLGYQAWGVLVEQYEQQIFQHFMTTSPHEQKKREGVYASFVGFQDFMAHMKAIIEQKNKLLHPEPLPDWAPPVEDVEE